MKDLIPSILLGVIWIAAAVGWVLNIVEIVRWNESTGMLVARIIGVFVAPVGAVLGWL